MRTKTIEKNVKYSKISAYMISIWFYRNDVLTYAVNSIRISNGKKHRKTGTKRLTIHFGIKFNWIELNRTNTIHSCWFYCIFRYFFPIFQINMIWNVMRALLHWLCEFSFQSFLSSPQKGSVFVDIVWLVVVNR